MKHLKYMALFLLLSGCGEEKKSEDSVISEKSEFISAADLSSFPEIEETHPVFYNRNGIAEPLPDILKENGVNTIRLRLWVNPESEHSGLKEVQKFAKQLKDKGFKIWLSIHYSDSWADPGHQKIPGWWEDISYNQLKDSVRQYTLRVMQTIGPDFVQIGNEINPGILLPEGNRFLQPAQFKELLSTATQVVRTKYPDTKIIIHFAGIDDAMNFFDEIKSIDFDIIGLSYYPVWHGKDLSRLSSTLEQLAQTYHKEVIIAETAYPFTLEWNDWTNNIVGTEDQLILPKFPASLEGQKDFIAAIRKMLLNDIKEGAGFCYWGGELIAWKGKTATDASPWENQALFDFDNKAVPALEVFNTK